MYVQDEELGKQPDFIWLCLLYCNTIVGDVVVGRYD